MIHKRFDLSKWQSQYSNLVDLDEKGEIEWFYGPNSVQPKDICQVEEMREKFRAQADLGPEVPADVFVLFPGEPEERSVTKIGGIPYRPAQLPWPKNGDVDRPFESSVLQDLLDDIRLGRIEEGLGEELIQAFDSSDKPLRFLAQFNFADSKDLVPELPGDVLLLFGEYEWPYIAYYEWHPLGLTTLIRPEAVPASGYGDEHLGISSAVWHGQINRTQDYPEAKDRVPGFQERACSGANSVFRLKAHRIGGAPYFVQEDPMLPGHPLCVFNGISSYGDEHPIFLDLSACIYISIDKNGKMHWADQCS